MSGERIKYPQNRGKARSIYAGAKYIVRRHSATIQGLRQMADREIYTRSMIVAIPMPSPMHIVTSA